MGLPAGIVEAEEPLSMPPVRQKSSPVLVTVIAAKGLSVVKGAECVSAKVSVHLYSLKHLVCLGQAVPSLWIVGSRSMGNWIVGSWGSIPYSLCDASGDRSLSQAQRWLAQVGLGSALLQLLWRASTSVSDGPCWKLELQAGGGGSF